MTFLQKLLHNCETYADKTALEFIPVADEAVPPPVSYGELGEMVEKTAVYLHTLGLQPGDRVAMQLPKCLPFLYLHLATLRLGGIVLPLNPAYPNAERHYFLADAEASLFFADSADQPQIDTILPDLPSIRHCIYLHPDDPTFLPPCPPAPLPPCPSDPATTALMIYTSGTTGRPKGAMSSHGNLTAQIDALHTAWGWRDDDILLHVLPIFHVHGLIVALHGALNAGATTLLFNKFDATRALQTLVQRRCTVFMAVPTIHRRLLDAPNAASYDLSHMRLLTSGSDRLPDDMFVAFQHTFGHTLLERYGMTETGMNLSNPLHGERRVGSVGLPLPGVEVRIVDQVTERPLPDNEVGEVQVRGPHVCQGYWRQPEKTAAAFTADGWLRTGDLGLREPDGYFTLKGREKDLIISGGYNVYPPEVELVLADHPAIAASAVVGCPDVQWGERVTAVIRLHDHATATAEEIIAYCRERLAAYKAPRQVVFVSQFPQNALGKVQKAQLRAHLCGE